jgi:hypothetical protein
VLRRGREGQRQSSHCLRPALTTIRTPAGRRSCSSGASGYPAGGTRRAVNVDPTAERAGAAEETPTAPCESPSTTRRQCQDRSSSAGARTPVGKLSGALKNFQAVDLGGLAIKAALEKSGTSGDQVDYVIMGTSSRRGRPVRISHARPYHPQTCGKVERLHQTMKKWLRAQPAATSLGMLQRQLTRSGSGCRPGCRPGCAGRVLGVAGRTNRRIRNRQVAHLLLQFPAAG